MASAMVMGFTMQSCLDYDTPTDDFKPSDVKIDDVILSGDADNIDYTKEITEEQLTAAVKNLSTYLDMTKTGQYAMRGGKNGGYPVEHAYQRQYTLTDVYAQYAVVPHHDFAFASELVSSYNVSKDWNSGPNGQFGVVRNAMVPLLNHEDVDYMPEIKACILLLLDQACIEVADIYGPFPYADFKANKDKGPFTYNSVESVYKSVKKNLDDIVACLKNYENRPEWYKNTIQEVAYSTLTTTTNKMNGVKGFDSYRRLANSLKLRMAMHMVKVEPATAQQWAEEAVADGVIESHEQEHAFYPTIYGGTHPLTLISNGWNDERVSASFVSLAASLQHPFMQMLFVPNDGAMENTQTHEVTPPEAMVVGIRSGVHPGKGQSGSSNDFVKYSKLHPMTITGMPLYIMKWAEVDMLRAEGALRGWNMGGTAQMFYERGIRNSSPFTEEMGLNEAYSQMIEEYIHLTAPVPYTYKDPLGITPDMESVTKIGVAWNEADSKEVKLEKIITQKYLAMFPFSPEAWTDMRRTGYPKVFPVLNPQDGDGSLADGEMVRRMLFPSDDEGALRDIKATGLEALGGPDQQAVRLWWDVAKPNF